MSEISTRLKDLIDRKRLSYRELAELTKIPKAALQRYATGATEKIPLPRIEALAKVLGTTSAYLIGWSDQEDAASGAMSAIIPMPKTTRIPLVGTIACGTPILAQENIESDVDLPEHIHADFALRCKGDSMINARIYDGDLVYIRQQETVENGEIAAVLIGDEATLKRVRIFPDHIALEPENPQYRPLVYWEQEMNAVRILGLAVAFTSIVR